MACTYDENHPSAPYDPKSLKSPLPSATKACLKSWLVSIPGGDFKSAGNSNTDSTILNGYQAALSVLHLKGGHNDIGIIVPIPGNPVSGFPKGIGGVIGGGGGGLSSILKAGESGAIFAALVTIITDPAFWVRALEVVIGALLVGVGLAHISTRADSVIKSIPLYGAAVKKTGV